MAARAVIRHMAMVLLAATALAAHAATAPERVTFPSFDVDRDGVPVLLHGLLFRPRDGGGGPVPAVVALHGCGGMYSIARSRRNELSLRHGAMAELLVAEGYAVLFPDSFRSRGQDAICRTENAKRTITQAHRRLDTLAALDFLRGRGDIARDRIAVLGWSHGGSAVLAALDANDVTVRKFRDADPDAPYFRAAIAFYPGCYESLRARHGYAPAAPLLLLVGGSDDWTSPRPCVALVERLRRASGTAAIVVYPDTYHGFDGPDSQGPMHLEMPNGVRPGAGVTVAVNAVAREDAYARVKAFLRTLSPGDH